MQRQTNWRRKQPARVRKAERTRHGVNRTILAVEKMAHMMEQITNQAAWPPQVKWTPSRKTISQLPNRVQYWKKEILREREERNFGNTRKGGEESPWTCHICHSDTREDGRTSFRPTIGKKDELNEGEDKTRDFYWYNKMKMRVRTTPVP